jgi:hypothetical protein
MTTVSKPEHRKSPNAYVHLTAGAISSLATVLALQPLDLLKTRLQQDLNSKGMLWMARDIQRHEGFPCK